MLMSDVPVARRIILDKDDESLSILSVVLSTSPPPSLIIASSKAPPKTSFAFSLATVNLFNLPA